MGGEVKGVIFDYGGVISQPQNKDCIKIMLRLLKCNNPDLFEKIYYKYRQDYDLGIFDGTMYWTKVIGEFGLEPSDGLIKKLHEQDVLSWTEINQEILETIVTLRNNQVKLGILSNMPPDILQEIRQNFKWLNQFDTSIFSCELGKVKPNPEIYRYSMDKLGLKPNEAVFIDDTFKNIVGAENVGLNTIWYQNFPEFQQALKQFIKMIA